MVNHVSLGKKVGVCHNNLGGDPVDPLKLLVFAVIMSTINPFDNQHRHGTPK